MKARDVLDQEIRTEGRRLLADLAAARETIDGDRVEDAKEAWVNFTYQHHDVLLADPAPVGLTDLSWVTEIKTVDAIDKVPVNAMMENPSWHLLHAGMGSGGQTTLTFGWGDRLSAAPVDDRERLAELEDWLLGAEHHAGCSGEYKNPDGTWSYRCKCGLRELRDERLVSPSVDPEDFAECDHCGGPLNADRPEENSSPGVAEPPDEERCPGCSRLPRVCSHGIYHHGCPSCDRQDPDDRE